MANELSRCWGVMTDVYHVHDKYYDFWICELYRIELNMKSKIFIEFMIFGN